MEQTTVRELMVPLDELPTVAGSATLAAAIAVLRTARTNATERLPYRLVLVTDDSGRVIGKLGHLAFLRGLLQTPGESPVEGAFDRAGVDPELVSAMTGHLRFFHENFSACCERADYVRIADVMTPVTDSVDANEPLAAGIRALLDRQQLSVFVRRGHEVVGLLRLADVFDWIADAVTPRVVGSGGR